MRFFGARVPGVARRRRRRRLVHARNGKSVQRRIRSTRNLESSFPVVHALLWVTWIRWADAPCNFRFSGRELLAGACRRGVKRPTKRNPRSAIRHAQPCKGHFRSTHVVPHAAGPYSHLNGTCNHAVSSKLRRIGGARPWTRNAAMSDGMPGAVHTNQVPQGHISEKAVSFRNRPH